MVWPQTEPFVERFSREALVLWPRASRLGVLSPPFSPAGVSEHCHRLGRRVQHSDGRGPFERSHEFPAACVRQEDPVGELSGDTAVPQCVGRPAGYC